MALVSAPSSVVGFHIGMVEKQGQIMRRMALVLGATLLSATVPAAAEWFYQGGADAFDGPSINIAAVDELSYMLVVRCRLSGIQIVFQAPGDGGGDVRIASQNRQHPKILLRVDSQPVRNLPTVLLLQEGDVLAISKGDRDLLGAIRDAKQRVAVAISVAGQNYNEVSFPATGSASALGQLMSGCDL